MLYNISVVFKRQRPTKNLIFWIPQYLSQIEILSPTFFGQKLNSNPQFFYGFLLLQQCAQVDKNVALFSGKTTSAKLDIGKHFLVQMAFFCYCHTDFFRQIVLFSKSQSEQHALSQNQLFTSNMNEIQL